MNVVMALWLGQSVWLKGRCPAGVLSAFIIRVSYADDECSNHLSGKPGNVREFETCQGNVREKKSSHGKVSPKLFITY